MRRYIDLDEAKARTTQLVHGYEVEQWLDTIPSIDICFCKECKWGTVVRNHSVGFCENPCGVRSAITESSYCSYGEREGE